VLCAHDPQMLRTEVWNPDSGCGMISRMCFSPFAHGPYTWSSLMHASYHATMPLSPWPSPKDLLNADPVWTLPPPLWS